VKLEFSGQFFLNTQISNIKKIHEVGDELFHGGRGLLDGHTLRS